MKTGLELSRILITAALSAAFFVASSSNFIGNQQDSAEHECRFWGIVFSQNETNVKILVRTHLDSLKSLGVVNYDGWGIAFFVNVDSAKKLPVIARGEPSAPVDPRYDRATEEMAQYCSGAGIAHVRRGSSGPSSGIPDPHPFRRKCVNRELEFLLAHNGNISTTPLMNLIQTINPAYIEMNPPDYSPDYIDSDLYSIYIAEILDMYSDSTVESCIRTAIVKLDSALNATDGEMNFVMSEGTTLWVLNYTMDPGAAITAYYSPDTAISGFWTAASEPLDTLSNNWVQIRNKMLVTLRPYEPPAFTPIYRASGEIPVQPGMCRIAIRSIPFNKTLSISYFTPCDFPVVLAIHDPAGKRVRTLFAGWQKAGEHTISWNGQDDEGKVLASGTYFCLLKAGDQKVSQKAILAR